MSAATAAGTDGMVHDAGGANGRPRIAWIDYSKGICIFLVVMLQANLEVQETRGQVGWLEHVVAFARPFRMPDFFLIAGLFLASALRRSWREYLDKKVLHFVYFYVLWAGIQFALFESRAELAAGAGAAELARSYLLTYVEPVGSLWFIHSLALYFLLVRITRRVPPWLILVSTATLQCIGPDTPSSVIDEFCQRFVYFYSGYLFAPQIFRMADWALQFKDRALAYLLVWGLAEWWLVWRGWSALPGLGLALGYFGAVAVVFMGALLSPLSQTGWLRYLGQNSIVVYLAYYTAKRIGVAFGIGRIADVGTAALALTVWSVAGALVIRWVTARLGMHFLFVRPAWARLKSGGAEDRRAIASSTGAVAP